MERKLLTVGAAIDTNNSALQDATRLLEGLVAKQLAREQFKVRAGQLCLRLSEVFEFGSWLRSAHCRS